MPLYFSHNAEHRFSHEGFIQRVMLYITTTVSPNFTSASGADSRAIADFRY